MKYLFCFAFAVITSVFCHAQDTLIKRKGDTLQVKLLEVNPDNIRYKKYTYQDGPTFTVFNEDVKLLIYQNGQRESLESYKAVKKSFGSEADNRLQMGGTYFYYHDKRITEPDMLAVVAKLNNKKLTAMSRNVDRLRFWQKFTFFGGVALLVSGAYVYESNRAAPARGGRGRRAATQTANNIQAQKNAKLSMLGGVLCGLVSVSFSIDRKKHDRLLVDAYNQELEQH